MRAMILAAGKGRRLGELTRTRPKALLEINGKSILHRAVEKCTASGFNDIIVNIHHFAGQVEQEIDRLNGKGFHVEVSDEREMLLETGGGLYKVRSFFKDGTFLLYNTDIITDMDIAGMLAFHLQHKYLATLAVRNREGNRFFLINDAGRLRGWHNRITGERIVHALPGEELVEIAFSGIHIIEPEIFTHMWDGVYTMTDLYMKLAGAFYINTYRYDAGYWIDAGTPDSLEKARKLLSGIR